MAWSITVQIAAVTQDFSLYMHSPNPFVVYNESGERECMGHGKDPMLDMGLHYPREPMG
jgi:hypothetical protein